MEPIDRIYPTLDAAQKPAALIAQISADALRVIEGIRQEHLLLCEELTLLEQISAIPNESLKRAFLNQTSAVSDLQTRSADNNYLRMQSKRRLDEVAYIHGMSYGDLRTHLERSMVLGDCLSCEWFVRSALGYVAL